MSPSLLAMMCERNNTANDNTYNAAKDHRHHHLRLGHQLKKLLQKLVKRSKPTSTTTTTTASVEHEDNLANERLEALIFSEIDHCPESAAVPVFDSDAALRILPVTRGFHYVPVHFARTDAGTFFWTTTSSLAESDLCCGHGAFFSEHQQPELQTPPDRWAQA